MDWEKSLTQVRTGKAGSWTIGVGLLIAKYELVFYLKYRAKKKE